MDETSYNTGVGVGFEFDTRKRIVWNIMLGYGSFNNFEKLFITGETALYYKF
jgi:hypothetical protein